MSITVSSSSMKLLQDSHFLVWFMVVSHYLSGQMEFQHVSYCLQLLLSVSHRFSNPME